ncbi:hypothetical protein OG339_42935 [Streptosporangium sp. NBC_01495]|uniref:hypothetical protein n=1 Tax=Streptosporangium sp. NBC_01495 TaxID=2903899 RepID=UPI002E35BC25|nr:hypothetical protein [Streptosporangium sp. NBC_01495]
MRLRLIFALVFLYVVTAAPAFHQREWRLIVYPASAEAAEVYFQPISPVTLRSYEGIEPFNRAFIAAEQRAETYSHDLAPPYIRHDPYQLITPYVTERGRELAALPVAGAYWSEGKIVRYRIVPLVERVKNSQAELRALLEKVEGGPLDETDASLGMGMYAELNRVVLEVNTFDQALRRRLAAKYGGLIAIQWSPCEERLVLLNRSTAI